MKCEGQCTGETTITETTIGECPTPCKHTFSEANIEAANAEARQDAIGYCQRKHGKANCICSGGKYFI
jgi:hypothetical protein